MQSKSCFINDTLKCHNGNAAFTPHIWSQGSFWCILKIMNNSNLMSDESLDFKRYRITGTKLQPKILITLNPYQAYSFAKYRCQTVPHCVNSKFEINLLKVSLLVLPYWVFASSHFVEQGYLAILGLWAEPTSAGISLYHSRHAELYNRQSQVSTQSHSIPYTCLVKKSKQLPHS